MLTLEWDLNEAKQAWREDGIDTGIGIGRAAEKDAFALKMIRRGSSIDDIHEMTELPVDRIKQLVAQGSP